MSINLKRVVSCQRCGQVLPTVEVAPGKFAAVQPLPVVSLAPGKLKIQVIGRPNFSPEQMATKLLEHSCFAAQTPPVFIPHDFVCSPDGVIPRLLCDLQTMQQIERQIERPAPKPEPPKEEGGDA